MALSGFQRMWYVVLPQAFRIAIPPVGNQYLNLIKNSSLGAGIGYYDITLVTQTTVGNGSLVDVLNTARSETTAGHRQTDDCVTGFVSTVQRFSCVPLPVKQLFSGVG